jgi:DNA-binding transcriptional ArsR family regulator
MDEFMAVTKALADENRTRVVMFLRGGELCVCQIIELLQLAPSTVSKHLTILYRAGLVEARKEGRWIYYGLAHDPPQAIREAIRWVGDSLREDPRVMEDAKRVKAVRKMDKDQLCCRYKTSSRK